VHCKNISISLKRKKINRSENNKNKIRESVYKALKDGSCIKHKLQGKHEEIKQMYLSKRYNQKKLSEIFNVKPTSIFKLLKKLGVK
jgi:hypothetical protein